MDSVNTSTILPTQNHRPTFIYQQPKRHQNITTSPSMGDHLAVLYDVACEVPRNTTLRRKLFKFDKANIPNMAQDMNSLHQTLREDWSCHTAEENWTRFHNTLTATMKRNILQTTTGKRNNLPWVTDAVKKSIVKRDRALKKAETPKFPPLVGGVQSPEELHHQSHSTRPWTLYPRHHWRPGLCYPECALTPVPWHHLYLPRHNQATQKPATTQGHRAWLSPTQDNAWPCRSDSPTPHSDIPTDLGHWKHTTRLEGCDR